VGYDKNNIFAKILRGEIPSYKVYEDAHTLSFMDVMPQSNGHTLVIPKSQAEDFFDVDPQVLGALMVVTQKIAHAVKRAFNPDGVRSQCEGGIVQGLSWALKERARFDREAITSVDWAQYPIMTFAEVPAIDIVLLDRPNDPSLGAGEATVGPASAALANAVASAIGKRVRDLPLSPERIKARA